MISIYASRHIYMYIFKYIILRVQISSGCTERRDTTYVMQYLETIDKPTATDNMNHEMNEGLIKSELNMRRRERGREERREERKRRRIGQFLDKRRSCRILYASLGRELLDLRQWRCRE
jgi:hypothetical protein